MSEAEQKLLDAIQEQRLEKLKILEKAEQLQRKNDALVARVARLESKLETAITGIEWYMECFNEVASENDHENLNEIKAVLNETESESLVHIQADAIKTMLDKAPIEMFCDAGYVNDMWIEYYSEKLRQQGKKKQ